MISGVGELASGGGGLAAAWLSAVRLGPVADELESIYAMASDAIEARGPACWASGRCCNFDRAGHRLYVTGLEAAFTVARLGNVWHDASAGGASVNDASNFPTLDESALAIAVASGGCPFQSANLCGVHTIRPLGCRVYFCDRAAETWQQDLSERLLAMIREVHARYAIEYRYGEWRQMLAMFTSV